jgi:hypothetical protein
MDKISCIFWHFFSCLKSVIKNDTEPHLGKSKQNQEISEFKIIVGTSVSHVQIISLQGKKYKKFIFFQNQNDTCAHLYTLVMKFHDRQSSER